MAMKPEALEALGRAAANLQDERTDAIVEEARARFVDGAPRRSTRPSPRARRRTFALSLVAVVAVAAAVLFLLRSREPSVLTFQVATRPGVANQWVVAPAGSEVPMQFSDGTTVLLGAGSRGNVEAISPAGARVRIETGTAIVSVPPRAGARWTFDVGPFAVTVTGTRFDVGWEASKEVFDLEVRDGSVRVTGPKIAGERAVVAGQKLRVALAISGDLVTPPPIESALPAPAPTPTVTDSTSKPRAPSPPPWRDLAKSGRYAEALAEATPTFDAICARDAADDVMLLGDTSRLGGDAVRAKKAYASVRSRFPGTSSAAVASFALGRLAAQEGSHGDAARWFETYGVEAPSGPLAREALGRAMEAREQVSDGPTARRHAATYLAKYPEGPHAKLARKIAGE